MDLRAHGRVPGDLGVPGVHVCQLDGARTQRVEADVDRRSVRADHRLRDRGRLRIHGGPHRRVEQPDLGCRHSVDRDLRVVGLARRDADGGDTSCARGVCAVRHGDRLCVRDDLERQLAGSENRSARRRVTDASADRAHRRRGCGCVGDSLRFEFAREGVWIRRSTEHRRRGGKSAVYGQQGNE